MRRCKGVSTKHLDGDLAWFGFMKYLAHQMDPTHMQGIRSNTRFPIMYPSRSTIFTTDHSRLIYSNRINTYL